jgi:hypothetical protein
MDDVVVLDKCETLPWSVLLTEGFRFQRTELGDVWWIGQETIMCYFRPLLLATLRVPIMLTASADWLQHAINMVLHLTAAALLLALCRTMLTSPRSAFLATLFFTVCFHPRWAVLLISARKELLVGVLVLLALQLHLRNSWKWAAVAFAGALLSGEHAVAFPFIAFLWDCLAPRNRLGAAVASAPARRAWPSWATYLSVLVVYIGVRTISLDGLPLPVPPYCNDPLTPGFATYLLLRPIILLFSLTTGAPFVDRPIIEIWFNHPVALVISIGALLSIITLLLVTASDRRLCATLLILAIVAYLPFLPLAAIPFYLYTPCIFYALAIGAALDVPPHRPSTNRPWPRRLLATLVGGAALVNLIIGIALSWGPSRPPFLPGTRAPQRVARAVAELLENEPLDRNVIFVDAPPPPPFFYFVYELSRISGRDPAHLAVVTCRHRRSDGERPSLKVRDREHIQLASWERPYFLNTVKKLLWCFPDGLIAKGRTFERDWLSVTIAATSEHPPGPRHFFAREPGITALSICVRPDAAPLIIGFDDQQPVVLADMDLDTRSVQTTATLQRFSQQDP